MTRLRSSEQAHPWTWAPPLRRRRVWRLELALVALLSVSGCTSQPATTTVRSAPALMQIDVQRGWAFKPDPSGQADWSAPTLDDGGWDVIDAGTFWQKQGYDGYAGVAWYRRTVDVPSSWSGRQAYLVIGGVNDQYQVYVDGHPQGQAGSLEPGASAILHATETPVALTAGKPNLLAIKVRSAHNFGGIAKGPVVLTTEPRVPPSPQQQAMDLAKAHPEGVWPAWMRGQGRTWTVTGLPTGGPESLEGPDGSWEATSASPSVSAWLVDHPTGAVERPGSAQDPTSGASWGLADGRLPLLSFGWPAGQVLVSTLLWQEPARGSTPASTQWHVQLHNEGAPRDVSLWVALRPYQVQPGVAPLFSVSVQGKTVLANGAPALISADAPTRVLASTGELGDVSLLAASSTQVRSEAVTSRRGGSTSGPANSGAPGSGRPAASAAPAQASIGGAGGVGSGSASAGARTVTSGQSSSGAASPDSGGVTPGAAGSGSALAGFGSAAGQASAAEDGSGLASLALVFDVHLNAGEDRQLSFAAPAGTPPAQPAALDGLIVRDPAGAEARWGQLLRAGAIQVPDKRVADAFDASLAYILMSNDGGALHPGPLLHDAFWYRDSAYMLAALERGGLLAQARDLLAPLTTFQTPDGEFPANASTHRQIGHRRGDPEWDSQGEGIHALVEYYRFSSDLDWLRGQWPAIDRAARWLTSLIGPDGLLPAGLSAEDLGPAPGDASAQHFWDDFWGVIGLRDAAYAASAVGDATRAGELTSQAGALLDATLAAGQPGLQREGIFPNSPNSRETPADARGTSPAVWPGQLMPQDWARSQFQGYFQRFITPYGGAFRHENNNFWPFGGLEIAHGSLFAGLPDQTNAILDWQLDHPTARGVWAWGDEVSQDGSQLIGGDMPHGWTAAEYVDLVRDMLLYEQGDTLQLAAGVPAAWLADGQTVAVTQLPTYFGPVTYRLTRSGATLTLDIDAAKPPPGGYDLHLPFVATSPAPGQLLHLPPDTRHVDITLAA